MSKTYALAREVTLHEQMRADFKALFPDADEETILDTLEGETDLVELIVAVLESAETDKGMAAACETRIAELTERAARFLKRADAKRGVVKLAMERSGRPKIEAPAFTVSLKAVPQSVIITAQEQIPATYMVQPEPPPPKPDKRAILEALKAGTAIAGCTLSNGGQTISVRRK